MLTDTKKSKYAKIHSLPHDAVTWTQGLWADSVKVCAKATVPQLKKMFDDKEVSHVVENFRICAKEVEGEHAGTVFGDGDFYKWMEAALYSATRYNDQALLEEIDGYIALIERAQQPDGYLSTKQIIGEMNQNGIARMGDINDFEVYNFGHLFTTACLHYRMTGSERLLNVAIRTADYLERLYIEAAQKGEVQTAVCPSHYMGLIEMYRTTQDAKYLKLATTAIELRDSVEDGTDDNQDRTKLKEHESIIGHAVRANYLYSGVADLYLETGDSEYVKMLDKVWHSLVNHKIYINGGCGALYNGVSPYGNFFVDQKVHQAYGYEYQLPNITAYNETCASVGLVMWAHRMFAIKKEAHFYDMLEKTMLNLNLAAISLDGRKYFYENMLRRTKELKYELVWPLTRTEYITSYCCPPNVARVIAQSTEYAYSTSKDTVYVGMYGANTATVALDEQTQFYVEQKTDYPYHGRVEFNVRPVTNNEGAYIGVRIPSWVQKGYIQDGFGKRIILEAKDANTFVQVALAGNVETKIEVFFDMDVRLTTAHPMVEEDTNQVAVEKGPLVYCVESFDIDVATVDDIMLTPDVNFTEHTYTIMDRDVMALEADVLVMKRPEKERDSLYQTLDFQGFERKKMRMIPYFAWDNRGVEEMKIWLPITFPYEKL